jgi:hypothetical protein
LQKKEKKMASNYSETASYWPLFVVAYLIINIRVEAGYATFPEQIVDGSVALAVVVFMLYVGARFFNLIHEGKNMSMIPLCQGGRNCCDKRLKRRG